MYQMTPPSVHRTRKRERTRNVLVCHWELFILRKSHMRDKKTTNDSFSSSLDEDRHLASWTLSGQFWDTRSVTPGENEMQFTCQFNEQILFVSKNDNLSFVILDDLFPIQPSCCFSFSAAFCVLKMTQETDLEGKQQWCQSPIRRQTILSNGTRNTLQKSDEIKNAKQQQVMKERRWTAVKE